jgi:hypothetical protein
MKRHFAIAVVVGFSLAAVAQSSLDDWKKKVEGVLNAPKSGSEGLTDERITSGLKEALRVSTGRAVASTGRPDGFLNNAAIKILLPPKLQTAGKTMRMVGMGSQVDQLEIGMNRAAEQATPQARQIFLSALTRMTFSDAREIFTRGDTAATEYFKRQSSDDLTTAFKPLVHQAMLKVGLVRQYNSAMRNPVFSRFASSEEFDLDAYVVAKTLDGLFYELGEEEKKIRKDPAAQTTALLREVFGSRQ